MDKTRRKVRGVAFAVIAFGLAVCNHSAAQITTDGSAGAQVTLNGPDVTIEESLGTRAGSNLFHSFDTFNISSGGSATFTGAADIQNVVSRVTGGQVSNIQGSLRSEVGNADVYFINPAGVTFGEGGSVDVPASFHLSTNDELRFTDGTVLETDSPTMSGFSVFEPEVFGYLSEGAGAIEVSGTDLVISNGDLGVTGSELLVNDATLVSFEQINIQMSGPVTLENSGSIFNFISNDSDTGGIFLSANDLLIDGQASGIGSLAASDSTANAGSIEILVTDLTTIQNGSLILSNATSEGNAGDILLTTGQLLIDTQGSEFSTGISSEASAGSTGNAGDIFVTVAGMASISDQGLIETDTDSEGDAGNIFVNANELQIDGRGKTFLTGILSNASTGSTGLAGTIEVVIAERVSIQNGGVIFSRTESDGDSGDVQVNARELQVDGQSPGVFTGIASVSVSDGANNAGDSGRVTVSVVDLVSLIDGAQITSSTFSDGDAGTVVLSANELLIDDQSSEDLTGISSSAQNGSTGNGGTIEITIGDLATIQNGGQVFSSTFSEGNAGTVFLTANRLLIDRQGSESVTGIASSAEPGSVGDAGSVSVVVTGQATVQNGGIISSSTSSEGGGGSVSVESTTGSIQLTGEARIVSIANTGTSNSGEVAVVTGGSIIIDDAEVSTRSAGGSAGPIEISAGRLDTRQAQLTTTTESSAADGGNVSIETEVFILEETLIQANAVSGNGGTITIDSDVLIPFGNQLETQSIERLSADDATGNVIQAVAEDGVTIPPTINAPETDISAAITNLNADPGNASAVASDPCASFIEGSPSSLVESGRSGFPVTNATLTNLPIVKTQVSFTEQRVSLASNYVDDAARSRADCRS